MLFGIFKGEQTNREFKKMQRLVIAARTSTNTYSSDVDGVTNDRRAWIP
jgi:hypothetical protein